MKHYPVFVLNGWAAGESAWDLCRFRRDRIFGYVEQLDGKASKALENSNGAVLVGWSMGGSTALRLAVSMPEKIKGLIFVAATARMMKDKNGEGMSERRLAALEAGLKMTRGEGLFAPPPGRPNPYILDTEANLSRGLDYLRETDLRLDLIDLMASGRFRAKTKIFQSDADGIVRPQNAKFLSAVFPGADVEIVPGQEHVLSLSIPDKIDAAVAEIAGR